MSTDSSREVLDDLPIVRAVRRTVEQYGGHECLCRCILEAIGDCHGWRIGSYWTPAPAAALVLIASCTWRARVHKQTGFETATLATRLAYGVGFPGRVWATRSTVWLADVVADSNFPRHDVAELEGLYSAVAFPVFAGTDMVGVVEFFTDNFRVPIHILAPVFTYLGRLFGSALHPTQSG